MPSTRFLKYMSRQVTSNPYTQLDNFMGRLKHSCLTSDDQQFQMKLVVYFSRLVAADTNGLVRYFVQFATILPNNGLVLLHTLKTGLELAEKELVVELFDNLIAGRKVMAFNDHIWTM